MTKNRNVMVEGRRCHSLKIDMEILILFAFASIMLSVIILVQLFKLNLLSNKCDLFDSPLLRGLKYTIYHIVNRIVCEASCYPVTQPFGHLIIQLIGHLVTRLLGHSIIQSFGHLDLVTRLLGHLVT